MSIMKFNLFKVQQERFCKALHDYDSNIWFPPIRGNFKIDTPSNWFIAFVPASWGKWKGASYGVHFGFLYGRPTREQPERFRLAIGVEYPMREPMRQAFKQEVVSMVSADKIAPLGIFQAKTRTKLFEATPIPFNLKTAVDLDRMV